MVAVLFCSLRGRDMYVYVFQVWALLYSTVLNNRLVVLIVLQGIFRKVVLVIIVPFGKIVC